VAGFRVAEFDLGRFCRLYRCPWQGAGLPRGERPAMQGGALVFRRIPEPICILAAIGFSQSAAARERRS
jgi:hypothetical protein